MSVPAQPLVFVLLASNSTGANVVPRLLRRAFAANGPPGSDASIARPAVVVLPVSARFARGAPPLAQGPVSRWLKLDRVLRSARPRRFAVVVAVEAALLANPYGLVDLERIAACLLKAARPDLLIPVLLSGRTPRANASALGERLLAATVAEDWRAFASSPPPTAALAMRLASALAEPVVPLPAAARAGRAVVRVAADGNGDCRRISEGLALAAPGGRVEVYPGVYRESPNLAKSVHLVGVGHRDQIRIVAASAVLLTPLHLTRAERQPWDRPARVNVLVENLTIEQEAAFHDRISGAISLDGGRVTVRDCDIVVDAYGSAVSDRGDASRGLRAAVVLERCRIRGGAWGIDLASSAPVTIRDCSLEAGLAGDGAGIRFSARSRGRVTRCSVAGFGYGVAIQTDDPGTTVTVSRTRIARASVAGILAGAGANAVVRHNHVSDARVGIATIARAAARIQHNLIDGETLAAISVASTGHVEVSHNRLLGSDRHIHAIEGADLVLGQNFSA